MKSELDVLASALKLSDPASRPMALAFGLVCARRIEYLLEEAEVLDCLASLEDFVKGRADLQALERAAERAAELANQHRGSKSIDGCGHAAVSATYGVAKALAGQALAAAHYCAYAQVYASGGYAAVAEREAFEPEFTWQVAQLQALAKAQGSPLATSAA